MFFEPEELIDKECPLCWNVFVENINARKIEICNIFNYNWVFRNGLINIYKEHKKSPMDKETFLKRVQDELRHEYWARAEYEVVITDWPPHVDSAEIDRLNAERDERIARWGNFYCTDVRPTIGEKIDIYDQVIMNWTQFGDYLWNNIDLIKKLKYIK